MSKLPMGSMTQRQVLEIERVLYRLAMARAYLFDDNIAICRKNSPAKTTAAKRTTSVTQTGSEAKSAAFNQCIENDGCIGVPASQSPRNMNPAPSGMPVARAMIDGITHRSLVLWFMTEF